MSSSTHPETPRRGRPDADEDEIYFKGSPLKKKKQDELVDIWENQGQFMRKLGSKQQRQDAFDNQIKFNLKNAQFHDLECSANHLADLALENEADTQIDNQLAARLDDFVVNDNTWEEDTISQPGGNRARRSARNTGNAPQDDDRAPGANPQNAAPLLAETDAQRRRRVVVQALAPLHVSVSEPLTIETLHTFRDTFLTRLLATTVQVSTRGQAPTRVALEPREVLIITNFFFSKTFGVQGFNRVVALVRQQIGPVDKDLDMDSGAATRAFNAANNTRDPKTCRMALSSLGHCIRLQGNESKASRGFWLVHKLVELRSCYDDMVKAIQRDDPAILQAFARAGVKTGRGHDLANQCKQYLTNTVQTRPNSLDSFLTQGGLLSKLIREYGYGILVLVPYNAGRTLLDLGVAKFVHCHKVWEEVIADNKWDFCRLCEIIELHVYDKVSNGERMSIKIPSAATKIPLVTRFINAVEVPAE